MTKWLIRVYGVLILITALPLIALVVLTTIGIVVYSRFYWHETFREVWEELWIEYGMRECVKSIANYFKTLIVNGSIEVSELFECKEEEA